MANDNHTIEFEISKDGNVSFVIKGVKGGGCTDVAKTIEKATGFRITRREATSDLYEQDVEIVKQKWVNH